MAVPEPSVLRKVGYVAKNITLFFLSPLIALGYVIALPLIGFYLIGKFSVQTIHEKIVSH